MGVTPVQPSVGEMAAGVIEDADLSAAITRLALGTLTVPQTVGEPPAVTSSQNATTNAATQTGSYVQADVQTIATLANALKVNYNAAQVDIAAIVAWMITLEDALTTAGIIS